MNTDLNSYIELKYGPPLPTDEYVNSLPDAVIELIRYRLKATHPYEYRWTLEDTRTNIRFKLAVIPEEIIPIIRQELYHYHNE